MSTTEGKSNRVRGDGMTYLRGQTYWVAFYKNGKLIRESAKTSDPEQALKYLRRCTKAAEKAEEANVPYLTSKDRKRTISDLEEFLQNVKRMHTDHRPRPQVEEPTEAAV